MWWIALKMLVGDRAKYVMLVGALTFSALLMTQQASVFLGLMRWTTGILRNIEVPIWVVDRNVEQVNDLKPMRKTDLELVRSVEGVAWAVPFYQSIQQARLQDGSFKSIFLLGLDSATLVGAPAVMDVGRVEDLWQDKAVILDRIGAEKLTGGRPELLQIGDSFEINDNEARVVGIADVERSFFGYPFVYTTFDRAVQMAPKTRRNLGIVMVQPNEGMSADELATKITRETGLRAFTENDFFWQTIWWYVYNTGIPISFGTTIILGFIVGIAVSGQTFYLFILDNIPYLGALKAMGASENLLSGLLLLQAFTVGGIGYGIGVGLASLFGRAAMKVGQPPFYMSAEVLIGSFIAIMMICMLSALIGIHKMSKMEPAEVFRG
ncbi:MAG: FtsX-like permease family protein [Chlamydiia bacterium]|nr:FtsX-like permease family protein [Chlamydiia bacterium]